MNHYKWCEKHGKSFFEILGINPDYVESYLTCDGDKCYSYKNEWDEAGIPFPHGVMIYLITKLPPYDKEVRNTPTGWVDVSDWIISNYKSGYNFSKILKTEDLHLN